MTMPTSIQVQNQSSAMTDQQVSQILKAVEAQVRQDAAPIWGFDTVQLKFFPKDQALDPNQRQFIVLDSSDVKGAAGYHQTTQGGQPIGYAFAKTTIDAGMNPSVTISHEILEMLGDELIDQYNIWSDVPNSMFLCQELCDPVESDNLAYETSGFAGIKLSNFVTPAYFIPDSAKPWDFRGVLTAPNSLSPGGYQLTWDPTNGQQAVQNKQAPSKRLELGIHTRPLSRTDRRRVGRRAWNKSEK
jgi:hypothetical protein